MWTATGPNRPSSSPTPAQPRGLSPLSRCQPGPTRQPSSPTVCARRARTRRPRRPRTHALHSPMLATAPSTFAFKPPPSDLYFPSRKSTGAPQGCSETSTERRHCRRRGASFPVSPVDSSPCRFIPQRQRALSHLPDVVSRF